MQLARVVRNLSWHRHRAYLTRTDYALLRQGRDLLAAEMALVSGDDLSATNQLIEAIVAAAMAGSLE
jgi:RNA polymerase-interacting CarD/CdnL/TRCF family regulator